MAFVRGDRDDRPAAMAAPSALRLQSYGVAFGERTILEQLSLELPQRGLTVLVGPAGGGKSTLLRTLAGLNDAHPSLQTWGEVWLGDERLPWDGRRHAAGSRGRPVLVVQNARFFLDTVALNLTSGLVDRATLEKPMQLQLVREALRVNGLEHLVAALGDDAVSLPLAQQRCLSVLRAALAEPACLFTDEPTAGLDEAGAEAVIRLLQAQAQHRSVLFVTHHQRLARLAGGSTLLLAHGRVCESAPTERFFSAPTTDLGRQFVATGSCPTTSPGSSQEALSEAETVSSTEAEADPEVASEPPASGVAAAPVAPANKRVERRRPRGFSWIIPGKLGGLPRPGIVDSCEEDLQGLAALGVTLLVTLEEQRTVDSGRLAELGIESVHFPIVDMGVPTLPDVLELCRRARAWADQGHVVAFHCLAGHGRTGTMLACQLIFAGEGARAALEHVRAVNPRHVQSEVQIAFLRQLELELALAEAPPAKPQSSTRLRQSS